MGVCPLCDFIIAYDSAFVKSEEQNFLLKKRLMATPSGAAKLVLLGKRLKKGIYIFPVGVGRYVTPGRWYKIIVLTTVVH